MSENPLDQDKGEIPLFEGSISYLPERPAGDQMAPGRSRPRARSHVYPVLKSLGWSFCGVVCVVTMGVLAAVVWDLLLYERFWGSAPRDRDLLVEWLRRRVVSARLLLLCGGVVGELAIWVCKEVFRPDRGGSEENDAATVVRWVFRAFRWLLLLWWFYLLVRV